MKKLVLASAVAGILAAASQMTMAADYTIRMSHIWPEVAGMHKKLLKPWADAVEAESNGRIAVEIYAAGTLAKPPAQYDAVKKGIADMSVAIQGYSAGRFPVTQVVELPGMATTAKQGSCIVQGLYDEGLIAQEYKDTHPLFMYTHGPGHIHTTEKSIKTPADMQGVSLRRPTAVVAKLMEELGAKPVGMPAPASYESVQRGVIDGLSFPWEGQLSFRLNELTKHHLEFEGGLYTLSFVATMNKRFYSSLPADLKQVIDNNSGAKWSKIAAQVMDGADVIGRQQAVDAGHSFALVEGGVNNPDWKPALDAAKDGYLNELDAKGLAGRATYARAQELAAACK